MKQIVDSASLLCVTPGCGQRWTCDFGQRLCSACDERRHARGPRNAQRPRELPLLREPARPFAEPTEPDEEYVHVD